MPSDKTSIRLIAENRKARHEFELLERLEFGIALTGTEVKSLRSGRCSIAEAYAHFRGSELHLVGATIPVYSHGNIHNHEPARERKLLAHARELAGWSRKVRERGMTIVPLTVYFKGARVKVELALARGKKLHDKRESVRERETRREIDRAMSRARR